MMHGGRALRNLAHAGLDEKLMSEDPPPELVFMVPENIFGFDIQEKKWGKYTTNHYTSYILLTTAKST